MADTSWVVTDKDDALYGEACGYEADSFVLSKKTRAQAFVNAKKSTAGKLHPAPKCRPPASLSSSWNHAFVPQPFLFAP